MERPTRHWIGIGFAASVLAVGIPFWTIPYAEVNLPDALVHPGLAVPVAAAAILSVRGAARFGRVVAGIGAAAPAAVLARVAVEVVRDPTSHNLWPFELAIALGVGAAFAAIGALAGTAAASLVTKLRGGRAS